MNNKLNFISDKSYRNIIKFVPIFTVDILLCSLDKFLLGLRKNRPARDHYFTPGGRVFKNEPLNSAAIRIAKDELNIEITDKKLIFLGKKT